MDTHNFLKFLEDRAGREVPFMYKVLNQPETLTEKDLIVKGDVNLEYTRISSLPDNLTIEKSLSLHHTGLEELPEHLTVGVNLWAYETAIRRLPRSLRVGNIVNLRASNVEEIEEGFTAEYVTLEDTPISTLPDNLRIGTYLNIKNTHISEIPKNLYVWKLDIAGTPLAKKYRASELKIIVAERGGVVHHLDIDPPY